jgi:thioredoxin-related protein
VQGKIAWFEKDLDTALRDAKSQQKLVMAFFGSDSAPFSVRMTKEVFEDDRVADALKDVICVRIDVEKQRDVVGRFNAQTVPLVVWFNSDGTLRDRVNGFKDPGVFAGTISRIKIDLGTINELRKKVAAKEDDIDLRFELYRRLKELGDIQGSSEQKSAIIKLDPQGTSRASHRFTYERITSEIEMYWSQTGELSMHKVEELQTFIEMESDVELIWDGWMRLANTQAYLAEQSAKKSQFADARDHRVTQRKCIARSWRGVPQEDPDFFLDWCVSNAELFWNVRDELTPDDKQFLKTLTDRLVDVFDKNALAHDLRARSLFLNGQRPQAIDELEKAIELDPSKADYKARLKQFRGD